MFNITYQVVETMSAKDDFELVKHHIDDGFQCVRQLNHADLTGHANLKYFQALNDAFNRLFTPRPLEQWHEDYGDCLWYKFPIDESPYVGSPLSDDWPDYHTHFTPLIPILSPEDMGVK